jgi:hypothetical protein
MTNTQYALLFAACMGGLFITRFVWILGGYAADYVDLLLWGAM